MRPPLPLPAAPRPTPAGKPARKPASGGPVNRADRKATSQDNAPAHKSSRRKGAANDPTNSGDPAKDANNAALDFAAMLAQNAASPATATMPTPVAGDDPKGSDPLGTDAAKALLRPLGLSPAIDAGGSEGAGSVVGADGATDATGVAGAAGADATKPAAETAAATAADPKTTDATLPFGSEAAAELPGGAISVPSELSSGVRNVAASAADAAGGTHRRDASDAAQSDGQSSVTAGGPDITDVASVAASSAGDAAPGSGEQSTGDQGATNQQQPDVAGAAAAAGLPNSAAGETGSVPEAPMPAHTVAPTIAQVAQSLRTSSDGTSRLVIRLDPVELGPVLVTLRTRAGMVDVSVRADNAGGAAAVAEQRAHIQQVLADHGLDLSSFNVSGGEASGGAGSATADAGSSDASGDGSPNGNAGSEASAASYADVQAQASGADGQAGDRRAFAAPQESAGAFRTTVSTSSADGAAAETAAPVRTVRREGTWL